MRPEGLPAAKHGEDGSPIGRLQDTSVGRQLRSRGAADAARPATRWPALTGRSWWPGERLLRPARHGAFLALAVYLVLLGAGHVPLAVDAHAYWAADPVSPYWQSRLGDFDGYFYSPIFAQLLWPLSRLPWNLFAAAWTAVLIAALYVQTGRWFGLVVPLVGVELAMANIHVLLGLTVAAGLVWPAAWAFALLTKITPGIGLLWFAVRREVRPLAIAALATAALVLPSFVLRPGLWIDWVRLVASPLGASNGIEIPLVVRLPVAAALIAWGSRTDRRWTLVVGSWLAVPALWWNSTAVLVALIPLLDRSVPLARLASRRGRPLAPSTAVTAGPVALAASR